MTDQTRPFWLDWDYDQANADIGTTSRYGNYLGMKAQSFADIWTDDPTTDFAATAWNIATGPIMAPGLVRHHPRITNATLGRSNWNGEMVADIGLVSPRPQSLNTAKSTGGMYYRDWHRNAWDEYEGVGEEDLSRYSYLLTEIRLLWQLPVGTLPTIAEVPTGFDTLFQRAVECLDVLVAALNREVGPIIEHLERE